MRYRIAVLMLLLLLIVLPVLDVLAAPAPNPYAILAIGPSPDLKVSDEQYRKGQKEAQTCDIHLIRVFRDPEVSKLPSIVRMKDPLPWLRKNLQVAEEDGGRRLRFTFRAGTRAEQVTILNANLRANIANRDGSIKNGEEGLRIVEKDLIGVEQRLKSGTDEFPKQLVEAIHYLRNKQIPEIRAAIDRVKQTTVIKWAR